MKNYASNRVRNVVLLGHSGSGKTTYSEAALYYSGATKRFGKVDEGRIQRSTSWIHPVTSTLQLK